MLTRKNNVFAFGLMAWCCFCRYIFTLTFTDTVSFIRIHNVETMGYSLLVYFFLDLHRVRFKLFLLCFMISFCLLMLTAFLPTPIRCYPIGATKTYLDCIKEWFYYIWAGLTVIIFIIYKPFKLA